MEIEASGAGEKHEETEVIRPKVLFYRLGGTHCTEPQTLLLDLYHVETWDLGHFPIPETKDKARFGVIHIY